MTPRGTKAWDTLVARRRAIAALYRWEWLSPHADCLWRDGKAGVM